MTPQPPLAPPSPLPPLTPYPVSQPLPDTAFINTALQPVLPDWEQGLKDLEQLGLAVQVTFIQLAAAADKLIELERLDPERLHELMRKA